MKVPSWLGVVGALLVPSVCATNLLRATSLTPCSTDGAISINHFSVLFFPGNNSAQISFDGIINYSGKFVMEIELLIYGYKALTKYIDPCSLDVSGLCPLQTKELEIPATSVTIDSDMLSEIPGQ